MFFHNMLVLDLLLQKDRRHSESAREDLIVEVIHDQQLLKLAQKNVMMCSILNETA